MWKYVSGCKLHVHLWKRLKTISTKKIKKLHKLSENSIMKDNVSTPLQKRLDIFIFSMICLIVAIFFFQILWEPCYHDTSCTWNLSEVAQQDYLRHFPNYDLNQNIFATFVNERYKGKFFSLNVVNLSSGNLISNLLRFLFLPKGY